MSAIENVRAREILDSRGNPTVYCEVTLEGGTRAEAAVPSGASTGAREAVELRDGDVDRYGGKGVLRAVENVNATIRECVRGIDADDQRGVDDAMLGLDGTPNKGRLGANAILAVSLAVLRASAANRGIQVYERIAELDGGGTARELPVPMFNILNGGAHAAGSTDFQEFMVAPAGLGSFADALRAGAEIYQRLRADLHRAGLATTVGDEGGFAPPGLTNSQALDYVTRAIEGAGYRPGEEVYIALDPAASEFYDAAEGRYNLKREDRRLTSAEMIEEYTTLAGKYPIYSIEDGLAEDDWNGWSAFVEAAGNGLQLVGDDLLVTQAEYLRQSIDERAANAILIKLNQVGTVSETLDTIVMAREAGFGVVVSHRSGETEDTTIADLAVGTGAGQIKTGAPARSERVAKYNRLLHIQDRLGPDAVYAGKRVLR